MHNRLKKSKYSFKKEWNHEEKVKEMFIMHKNAR